MGEAADDDPTASRGSTQLALASVAAEELDGKAVWRQDLKQWWMCSTTAQPGIWSEENREGVFAAVAAVVFSAKPEATKSTVDAVKGLLKPMLAKKSSIFDKHPWLLGVKNGVVDLEKCELREPDPDLYLTRATSTAYLADSLAPKWREHVKMLFDGDEEVAHCFQKQVGAALVGDVASKPQVFVTLEGAPGSGKGTAFRTLSEALGTYAVVFNSGDFSLRQQRHLQWMTRLNGARVGIIEELGSDALDVRLLKTLSGGDSQVAHKMREDDATWKPTHTLFFSANVTPNFDNDTQGLRRRYVPVPTGPERTPVSGYEQRLFAERDGVLAWCIEGTRMWLEEDSGGPIALPDRVINLRDAQIATHDLTDMFLEHGVVLLPKEAARGNYVSRSDVQRVFREWVQWETGQELDWSPKDRRHWNDLYVKIGRLERVELASRSWKNLALLGPLDAFPLLKKRKAPLTSM